MNDKTNLVQRLASTTSKKHLIAIAVMLALGGIGAAAILGSEASKPASEEGHGDSHGHSEAKGHADGEHHDKAKKGDGHDHAEGHADTEHHEEAAKGPRGGEMHTEGKFSTEVLLAEDGGEPRIKLWLNQDGKPLAPAGAKVTAQLTRPSGEKQELTFTVQKDALVSAQAVPEPHVFEGTIAIAAQNESFLFPIKRNEGMVAMTDAQMKATSISLDTAGPATIRSGLQLPGEIRFNEDRTAHVVPRVAGVVESVPASIGQTVRKGQVLAVISSPTISEQRAELQAANKRLELARTTYQREKKLFEEKISPQQDVLEAERALREAEIASTNAQQKLLAIGAGAGGGALNRYELRAPFDGIIVEKHIALGEQVKEDANVFTISDLRSVWAQISVPAKDLHLVRLGERVTIRSTAFDQTTAGTVAYVGSLLGEQNRAAQARVELANPQMAWRPGLFVNVEVVTAENSSPVTVAADAIQTLEDKPVVFLRVPGGFIPQPIQVGHSDGKRTEVLKGLQAGSRYASTGSFVIKSEAGKGSATHSH